MELREDKQGTFCGGMTSRSLQFTAEFSERKPSKELGCRSTFLSTFAERQAQDKDSSGQTRTARRSLFHAQSYIVVGTIRLVGSDANNAFSSVSSSLQ